MKRFLLLIALGMSTALMAQTDAEALRYSMLDVGGSARYIGMGGAFSAVGADFSLASINPGALAMFRKSELFGTADIFYSSNRSSYFGSEATDSKANLNFNSYGMVLSNTRPAKRDAAPDRSWLSTTFAIGVNRQANFHNKSAISAVNPHNSMIDFYVEQAEGTGPSQLYSRYPYGAGLGYEAWLFDPNPQDTLSYISGIPAGGVLQQKRIESSGALNEMVLSVAGNYGNKLMIGATLGIPTIRYFERTFYSEEDHQDSIPFFEYFELDESLQTRGSGINAKVGVVVLVSTSLRWSLAVHSPTWYRLSDRFNATMSSDVEGLGMHEISAPQGSFDYRLRTPWRAIAGLALVDPGLGLLSLDYELVDYSNARYSFGSGTDMTHENELNNNISTKYGFSHNLRLGGEAIFDIYRFRAGIGYQTSAFKPGVVDHNLNYSRTTISLGTGFRLENFYGDVAYAFNHQREPYFLYTLNDLSQPIEQVDMTRLRHRVTFTLGVRF